MKITLTACVATAAFTLISCDPALQAQTQQVGSTVTTKVILGTSPQPALGFPGTGKACSNYNTQFFDPTTNTVLACVNTGVLAASTTGVMQVVNTGGTSGLPSSGTNTIPFVTTGGSTRPVTASDLTSIIGSSYASLPSVTALLKGNGAGGAVPATATDIVSLFGTCSAGQVLSASGTCVTQTGGSTIPSVTQVLRGNGSGNATSASASDIVSLFGTCTGGQVLGAGGTCVTASGASLPTTTALLKGNGSGSAAAAAVTDVTSLFTGTCNGTTLLSGAGTCVTAPAATIASGNTASVPSSGTVGSLYNVTDATTQSPYYFYNSSGNPVPLFSPGPSGGVAYNTSTGQFDIVTTVVPRLAAANSFTGSNTFGGTTAVNNLTISGTCTGCSGSGFANPMTTLGDLIAGGTSGAPSRLGVGSTGQVLTVSGGGQPSWANIPASSLSALSQDGSGNITQTGTGSGAIGTTYTLANSSNGHHPSFGVGSDGTINIFNDSGSLEAIITQNGTIVSLGVTQANGGFTTGSILTFANTATVTCASGQSPDTDGAMYYVKGSGSTNGSLKMCSNQSGVYTVKTIF